jgi:hypothetical protein
MGTFFNTPVGPIAGASAAQPYANHKLTPSLEVVPPPPVTPPGRTPQIIALNASIAQPSAWPYVYLDPTTGAQPYAGPTPTPPSTPVVITYTPYSRAWMATVVQSWFADTPRTQLPSYLVEPGPVAPSPYSPFSQTWLSGVIRSWFIDQPALVLPIRSAPWNLVVPNPPFPGSFKFQPVYPPDNVPPQPIHCKRFIDPTFRRGMAGGSSPCAIDSTPA